MGTAEPAEVAAIPVVLMPGLDGTGDLFEPFLSCCPPEIRPVVVRYGATVVPDIDSVARQLPAGAVVIAELAGTPPRWAIRRYLVGRTAPDSLVSRVARVIASCDGALLASRVRHLASIDARESLRSLRLPLLYLRGDEDRLISERYVDEVLSIRPETEVVRVPGPHFLLQARPEQCWSALRSSPIFDGPIG